jgi:hypothetical protein
MQWLAFNILGFQAVWWACVLGAGAGSPWMGPIAAAAFAAIHLRFTPTRRRDARLLVSAVVMGLLVDSTLGGSGLLSYASNGGQPALAPAWILALWAGFALTLTHSMKALAARPWAAAIFGLLGGPLAYASAGAAAGAVTFDEGIVSGLLAVAVAWSVAVPLLYRIDKKLANVPEEALA